MKKLYTLVLCLALLVLAACGDNLFGSSNSGSSDCGKDIKCLRIDAENAFRRGDDSISYEICSKILDIDSTVSFGYFCMAKASLWWYDINPLSIFSVIRPKEDEFGVPQCPLMSADINKRNGYLQAMKKIVPVLSELDRRDTLTALYERYKSGDISDTVVTKFKDKFCGGSIQNCKDTTAKKEPFPLSDREFKSSYFGGVLFLSSFTKWFLGIFDTNGDGRLETGCQNCDLPISATCPKDSITGEMSVVIDTKEILDNLKNDLDDYYKCLECKICDSVCPMPSEVDNINKTIDDFVDVNSDNFKDLENIINNLGLDTTGLKDEIDKYKSYASFYKVGTHIDEDGDGCIDEDLLDGQDNDGDGLPNANARLASVDPPDTTTNKFGYNEINNSMFGSNAGYGGENLNYNKPVLVPAPFKVCNDPKCSNYTELWGDGETVTIIGFVKMAGYWTSNDMALKLKVAQDTICPPQYDLKYRKEKIGGCWPYYDETKFVQYWLKRKLASEKDQANRVSQSCKTCNGTTGCLK